MAQRIPILAAVALLTATSFCSAQLAFDRDELRLTVEKAGWHLRIPSKGFRIEKEQYNPDGTGAYLFLINEEEELNLSFYIEPMPGEHTAAEMRDGAWAKEQAGMGEATDVTRSESDQGATIQYLLPTIGGMKVNQKNLRVHLVRDGYWIDVHLSKILFEEKDQALFDNFAGTLSFAPKDPATSGSLSLYYFQRGSGPYQQKNYAAAIKWYERSLALEQRERKLSGDYWKVLIDNLGMAYALSGQMEKARATFSYGASKDSTYPMFSYNLACVEAELGNMEGAITYLRSAFAHREMMPNPRTDSSFKPYLDNPRFAQTLKEIEAGGR